MAEVPEGTTVVVRTHGAVREELDQARARALTVVKLLIARGIPARHLAAAGFGENQPVDLSDTPEAYARNRRIELRLTDR